MYTGIVEEIKIYLLCEIAFGVSVQDMMGVLNHDAIFIYNNNENNS